MEREYHLMGKLGLCRQLTCKKAFSTFSVGNAKVMEIPLSNASSVALNNLANGNVLGCGTLESWE